MDAAGSPAEGLVLLFEPGERVAEVLRHKVRPKLIADIEIGVHGLNREKSAQPAGAAPAHDQVDAGDFAGVEAAVGGCRRE